MDYFHVLLGIQNGTNFRYISIDDYMKLTGTKPRILSVQLGALIRSSQTVGRDSMIKDDQKFQVLDKEVTVKRQPQAVRNMCAKWCHKPLHCAIPLVQEGRQNEKMAIYHVSRYGQQGATLIVVMILLLAITIIGTMAIRQGLYL